MSQNRMLSNEPSLTRINDILQDEMLQQKTSITDEEMKKYIQHYLEKDSSKKLEYKCVEDVCKRINKLHLNDNGFLRKEPLLLMMTLYVLPHLENYRSIHKENAYDEAFNTNCIFHFFTILLQNDASQLIKDKYKIEEIGSSKIEDIILQYSINLATNMQKHFRNSNEGELYEINLADNSFKDFNRYFPTQIQDFTNTTGNNSSMFNGQQDSSKKFQIGREACLLLTSKQNSDGATVYSFIHPMFVSYYASLSVSKVQREKVAETMKAKHEYKSEIGNQRP